MATKKAAAKKAKRKVFIKIEEGQITEYSGLGKLSGKRELLVADAEAKHKAAVPEYGEIQIWEAGRLTTRILTGANMCIYNESGVGPCQIQGGRMV